MNLPHLLFVVTKKNQMTQEMTAYRLRNDYYVPHSGFMYEKGRIFLQWRNFQKRLVTQLLASPTRRYKWGGGFTDLVDDMARQNQIEEIELKELDKIKPHWNKELRLLIQK